MADAQAFIDGFLHETRYDPVKAHEYYIRTRELKGRRSSSQLKSTRQKEGWQFVKSEVSKERKASLDKARTSKEAGIAALRDNAERRRETIRTKLRSIMAKITQGSKASREDISKDVQAEIDRLPKVPKGLSKEQTAKLAQERREKIAKIRGEGRAAREKLGTSTKAFRTKTRDFGAKSRDQVRNELSKSIDKARSNYEAAKEAIKAKYEVELDKEFENIRKTVR